MQKKILLHIHFKLSNVMPCINLKKKSNYFLLSICSILNFLNKTVTIFIAFSIFPPLNNININNLISREDHPQTQLKYDVGS